MNRFTIFLFLFISYTNAYALKPVSPLQKVLTGNLTNNESYALKEIKIISDITKDPKTYDEIIRNIYGQLNNVGNHLMSRFGVFLQVKNEKCGVYLYVRNWLNDNEDSINYSLPIEACEEIALRYSAFEKEFPDESEEQSKVKYLFSTSNSPDFFVKKPQLAQETVEQIVVTIFGELLKKLQEEKPDLVEVTKKEYVILSWMNKTFYVFAGEKEILFKKRNLYQTERQENFIKLKSLVDTLDFNTNAKTEELKEYVSNLREDVQTMYDGRLKSTTSKDKVSFDQMNLSTILSESKIQRVEKEINVVLEKEVFYKDILKVIDSRLNELSLANKDSNLELQ